MAAQIFTWTLRIISIGLLVMLVCGYGLKKRRRKSVYEKRGLLSMPWP